jgi:hypothetical protein
MTNNNFIEHLITRSTKKTTIPYVKPEFTPETLFNIFQLPPNYRQQLYTEAHYSQTNAIQKQNNPLLRNDKNKPPLQSTSNYPKTQKNDIKSREQVDTPKRQVNNSNTIVEKAEQAFQDDVVVASPSSDALRAEIGGSSVVEQSSKQRTVTDQFSKKFVSDSVGVQVASGVVDDSGGEDVSLRVLSDDQDVVLGSGLGGFQSGVESVSSKGKMRGLGVLGQVDLSEGQLVSGDGLVDERVEQSIGVGGVVGSSSSGVLKKVGVGDSEGVVVDQFDGGGVVVRDSVGVSEGSVGGVENSDFVSMRMRSNDQNVSLGDDVVRSESSQFNQSSSSSSEVRTYGLGVLGQVDLSKGRVVDDGGLVEEEVEKKVDLGFRVGGVVGSSLVDGLEGVAFDQGVVVGDRGVVVDRSSKDVVSDSVGVQVASGVVDDSTVDVSTGVENTAENTSVPLSLSSNEQKIIPEDFTEFVSPSENRWTPMYQPKTTVLRTQDKQQTDVVKVAEVSKVVEVEPINSTIDVAELKPVEITASEVNSLFDVNPIPETTPKPHAIDNFVDSRSVYLRDNVVEPTLVNPSTNFTSKKTLEDSPTIKLGNDFFNTGISVTGNVNKDSSTLKIRNETLDTTHIDAHKTPQMTFNKDNSLKNLEKTVAIDDVINQPENPLQMSNPSTQISPSFSPKPLTPKTTTTATSLNPVVQNSDSNSASGSGRFVKAKSPKPVLPEAAVFSKPQVQKEAENTVTIHIGRIEVHAVREQEKPVSLPRAPVLSLSDYLKQRMERD